MFPCLSHLVTFKVPSGLLYHFFAFLWETQKSCIQRDLCLLSMTLMPSLSFPLPPSQRHTRAHSHSRLGKRQKLVGSSPFPFLSFPSPGSADSTSCMAFIFRPFFWRWWWGKGAKVGLIIGKKEELYGTMQCIPTLNQLPNQHYPVSTKLRKVCCPPAFFFGANFVVKKLPTGHKIRCPNMDKDVDSASAMHPTLVGRAVAIAVHYTNNAKRWASLGNM